MYWNVISNSSYHFKKNKVIGDALGGISKEDVLRFYDKYILDNDDNCRKKFSVHVVGKNHVNVWDDEMKSRDEEDGQGGKVVRLFGKEVFEFKSNMALYPMPCVVDVDERKVDAV